MRLLIAEDEKDLNQVITKTLQKNHYSVDSCLDGQEALDCLDMAEYDAIILDIMMPRVSGLEVLKSCVLPGIRLPFFCLPQGTASRTGLPAWIPEPMIIL